MIEIVIGGDLCPIGKNQEYFVRGDTHALFNGLLGELSRAALTIINLECPLVDKASPIAKIGPNLASPTRCINGIKQGGVNVVNLANNHIMDHGREGLESTLKTCEEAGILTVGAGKNLYEASRPLIINVSGVRIGLVGMAEHEFSIATENSAGANPIDLIAYVRNVKRYKKKSDYLIVLLHGGNEHYPIPSPRLKRTCRFLVEMGANCVIVQHTHCPGCYENYENGYIVYGQGNLIFDMPNQTNSFYEGFLVKLKINNCLDQSMSLVPYEQSLKSIGTRKMDIEREKLFLQKIEERSHDVINDAYVKEQWLNYCDKKARKYIIALLGHNRVVKKLNRYNMFLKSYYSKTYLHLLYNKILCESHREIINTIISSNFHKKYF